MGSRVTTLNESLYKCTDNPDVFRIIRDYLNNDIDKSQMRNRIGTIEGQTVASNVCSAVIFWENN